MDLKIADKLFVVTGGTSGFGLAIVETLLQEGAQLIVNARGEKALDHLGDLYGNRVEVVAGDISTDAVISEIFRKIAGRSLEGLVINAGGPPAMSFLDTEITDWDKAYESLLRWKIKITKEALDIFLDQNYGRLVYMESSTVKQPLENLVLSNSMRLAVVGMVKTLSQEVASKGITANVIAPGYHDTPAIDRLVKNKATNLDISEKEAKLLITKEVKVGFLGDARDLASMVAWILSPHSKFITGQTISMDGGVIKGTMG
ncbi:MAG: SDR family oxidoreductase [Saprospiraceae bacterium]|nr:SDR family oxidoreductase [Saprospiraceae bacterium]